MRFGAMRKAPALPTLAAALLAACQPDAGDSPVPEPGQVAADVAETSDDTRPYDGIREDETLQFTGTEPFWGGEVTGRTLTYKTPENQAGEVAEVERFAGRGGLSFTGMLDGKDFTMTVTPLSCSDGMSDRTYPFTVTLMIGEETRSGCGWTDRHPFEGPAQP